MRNLDGCISRTTASTALKKLGIFSGILADEYEQVLHICHVTKLHENQVLFAEGDHSDAIYVLLSGEVEISCVMSGQLQIVQPGDLFGEIGVICQIPRTAAASALHDCILLRIDKNDLVFLLGKHPRISAIIMKNLAQTLSQRLISTNNSRAGF